MPAPVVPAHFPLAALLWPQRAGGISGVLRSVILVALGTALLDHLFGFVAAAFATG